MKKQGLFIIGTDTDAGKTFFTARLGALLTRKEKHSMLLKPIASGAKLTNTGTLYSEDCREIKRLANLPEITEETINPILLTGEYSPKIAAQISHKEVNLSKLKHHIINMVSSHDYTLIEGAGGITTPLSEDVRLDEFLVTLQYPLLLITDGKLGSINRTLLTAFHAKTLGLSILGIIVNDQNQSEPFLLKTNCTDIEKYTGIPILATLPYYTGSTNLNEELTWAQQHIPYDAIMTLWNNYYKQRSFHA